MNIADYGKRYIMGGFDKREVPRIRLASIAPMDSSKWDLELSNPATAPELELLLDKYVDQDIEENLFFGKTFLTAAFGRMNTLETSLLTVWETSDDNRQLRMYFPVVVDRLGLPSKKVWRCWSHDYAPLGVPIVSSQDAGEVLDRFLQLLTQIENPSLPALVFPDIPLNGIFASRLREAIGDATIPYAQIETGSRAVLARDISPASTEVLDLNSKKKRQLRRQLRRLGESGDMKFEKVENYTDIILRFEEFLLLEARGWKGSKGTSMHTIKQTAAFARQAVTELAKNKQSMIYSIRINDKSIASLIVLSSNGVYYPWKIAFDQDFASFSPGALLMFQVSEEIGQNIDFKRADSLAGSSNQLVNLLWKKRMDLGSLILPVGGTSKPIIEKIANNISRKNTLREKVKSWLNR